MGKINNNEDFNEDDFLLDFYAGLLVKASMNKIRRERKEKSKESDANQDQVSS